MSSARVIATTREAYGFLFGNGRQLFVICIVPISLYIALGYLAEWISLFERGDRRTPIGAITFGIDTLAELAVIPVYVAWSRATLRGTTGHHGSWLPKFGRREVRFSAYYLAIYLTLRLADFANTMVLGEIFGIDRTVYNFVITLELFFLVWIYAKLSFVFVEISNDVGRDLMSRWRLTNGQTFNLFLITVVIWLPIIVIGWIIEQTSELAAWDVTAAHLTFCVLIILDVLGGAVWISAMSIAYREIVGWTRPENDAAT